MKAVSTAILPLLILLLATSVAATQDIAVAEADTTVESVTGSGSPIRGDGSSGWLVGQTTFSLLSRRERDLRLQQRPWPRPKRGQVNGYQVRGLARNCPYLDWRDNGGDFVTGIRDQGDCAAGWVNAVTGAVESAFLIGRAPQQVSDFNLSESQALTCLHHYGFAGDCQLGWPEDLLWLGLNAGLVEEGVTSWEGEVDQSCAAREGSWERRHYLADYGSVCARADLSAIKDALHRYGPLLTTMTVHEGFETYSGGVYRASGAVTGYHAAVIIGYDDRSSCFLAKNSWGEGWGEEGFFKIAYDNSCDFGNWTSYVVLREEREPFAAMSLDAVESVTGAEIVFRDRSLPGGSEIISWEWDLDGDGEMDRSGPGPHTWIYIDPGSVQPAVRITDDDGMTSEVRLTDALSIRFAGPVWRVDADDGSDYGDGSRGNPLKSIQLGLDRAADGDTVLLAPGRYRGIMNTALNLRGKSLTIIGEGEPGDVVIDGQGEERLLLAELAGDGSLQVSNVEFRDGRSEDRGGAVLIVGGSSRFNDCSFVDCRVTSEAGYGGGAVWLDGDVLFESCRFLGNRSGSDGGAVTSAGGVLELDRCLFQGNRARARGGALCATGGDLTVDNTVLLGNGSAFGAALYLIDSRARLQHLTIVDNDAEQAGGAVALLGREPVLLANSILWGNEASRDREILAPGLEPGSLRHCLISGGYTGFEIIDDDPRFRDLENGDLRLDDGSPCLSMGSLLYTGALDFQGELRPSPHGSRPDLGALESEAGIVTGISEEIPPRVELTGIYPNPFNPTTSFSFSIMEPAEVRLQVFLPTGRLVATPVDEPLSAGEHRIPWTAVDEQGELLPSGVFLIRLECRFEGGEMEEEIGKATLLK